MGRRYTQVYTRYCTGTVLYPGTGTGVLYCTVRYRYCTRVPVQGYCKYSTLQLTILYCTGTGRYSTVEAWYKCTQVQAGTASTVPAVQCTRVYTLYWSRHTGKVPYGTVGGVGTVYTGTVAVYRTVPYLTVQQHRTSVQYSTGRSLLYLPYLPALFWCVQ